MRELLGEVLAPDLDGIHAELPRHEVDASLYGMRRFRPPGSTVGVGWRCVGQDADGAKLNVLEVVRTFRDRIRGALKRAEHADVGTSVDVLRDLVTQERAVLFGSDLDVEDLGTSMMGRGQVLRPLFHPLDRLARKLRCGGGEVLLRIDVDLAAETASNVGGDHPNVAFGNARCKREAQAHPMRHLRRAPHRQLVLDWRVLDHERAPFHGDRKEPLLKDALLDDYIRLGERSLHVTSANGRVPRDVVRDARMSCWAAFRNGAIDVDDRRHRLVIDLHQ